MSNRWSPGDLIVRRERLGLQPAEVATPSPAVGVWYGIPVQVVEDSPSLLVSYIAPGAVHGFVDGPWPTSDGLHPWYGNEAWSGHGCLMIQHPEEHHAVWHFWRGPEREFLCWYVNLQTSFVRTPAGYDTQDLELDIVVSADGTYVVKDDELLDDRVAEGRYSAELVRWVRAYGAALTDRLDAEGPWWDLSWSEWAPDERWVGTRLPDGWESI